MEPYKSNPGDAAPQPPSPQSPQPTPQSQPEDLSQTRYFPPQESYAAYRAQEQSAAPESGAPGVPGVDSPSAYSNQQYGGQPNQQPYSAPPPYMPPGTNGHRLHAGHQGHPFANSDRDRTMLGLALLGGGILFFLGQFPFFPDFGHMVLLLIGGIFMYAYSNTRPGFRVGFLIPGAILLGIGVGQALSDLSFLGGEGVDNLRQVTLGLGFVMIWLFERKHWWALIPGGIMVLTGLSKLFWIAQLWPLALIALGVYVLYEQSRHGKVR